MEKSSREKRKHKMWMIAFVFLLGIIILGCILLPPGSGRPKPFLDVAGKHLPGSISEKIHVDINGVSLGMFLMAKDERKPVVLFLGGGPGIPEYFLEHTYPTGLENEFVVCYLEYRGTSRSYNSDSSPETMTTVQYIDDVVAVTHYLQDRFGKDKIYLMGHSFGTYIGLKTASQYPALYHAYIAMGQITDQRRSEEIAYTYMKEQYQVLGNLKAVRDFEAYPILTSDEAYQKYTISLLRDNSMHALGVGTMRNMKNVMNGIFFPSLRCAAYTPIERINIWRGKAFAQKTAVAVDRMRFNAFVEVPALGIPVFFLAGKYDYTCSYALQKEYYDQVQAPQKAFYTFENAAHSPLFEDPEKARAIFSQDILKGTISLSDLISIADP